MVKILKLKFRQDLRLASFYSADLFLEVMKLNLGQDSEARFEAFFFMERLMFG